MQWPLLYVQTLELAPAEGRSRVDGGAGGQGTGRWTVCPAQGHVPGPGCVLRKVHQVSGHQNYQLCGTCRLAVQHRPHQAETRLLCLPLFPGSLEESLLAFPAPGPVRPPPQHRPFLLTSLQSHFFQLSRALCPSSVKDPGITVNHQANPGQSPC